MYSKELIKGTIKPIILKMLSEQDRMYGYEIVRGIRERSANTMDFGEGVIYPVMHSLEKRRLLATRRDKVNGRVRIYYRLTKKGQKVLREKVSHWQRVASAISAILDDSPNEVSPA